MPEGVMDPNLQEDLNTYVGLRRCLHQWLASGVFWQLPEQLRHFVLRWLLELRRRLLRMRRKIVRMLAGGALAASLAAGVAAGLQTSTALPPGGASGAGVVQTNSVSFAPGSDRNLLKPSADSFVVPSLVDIDNDADIDVFLRTWDGTLRFFENIGDGDIPRFMEQTGAANPFDGLNAGGSSVPSFVDIHSDGDFDLVIRSDDGTLRFLENTGDAASPTFVERTGAANPFDGVNVGGNAIPAFADIDNDGDVDAFFGTGDGTLRFYRNTGGGADPTFVEQTGAANPFDGVDVGDNAAPSFVDIDNDGDFDVFIGAGDGTVRFFRNTGSATNPTFAEQTGENNPFDGVDVGENAIPTFVDVRNDGDFDAIIRAGGGTIRFFENTGDATNPTFVERRGVVQPPRANAPGANVQGVSPGILSVQTADVTFTPNPAENPLPPLVDLYTVPSFVDIDGDGDLDAFVGDAPGTIKFFKNTGDNTTPAFERQTGAANPLDGVDVGDNAAPAFVDIDDDGDFDAFIGERYGTIRFFENTGDATNSTFVERTGAANPFDGVDVGDNAAPAFVDIDNDGDVDAFIGAYDGTLRFFENTGDATNPTFVERTGASNPFDGVNVGSNAVPAFVDIDDDGDFDAFIGEKYGTLRFFENTGDAANPAFVERTGAANPFDGVNVGYNAAPVFVDIDSDGDFDAFIGARDGTLRFFENTGDAANPTFVERMGGDNPLNIGVNVDDDACPTFVDIDNDSDFDAFIGAGDGTVRFYKNTGDAANPTYEEQTGGDNPFDGVDVGYNAAPAFVDIDNDGDYDAFIGAGDGTIRFFENTGDGANPTFVEQTGAANPFDGVDVGDNAAPSFVDIDNDGDFDAFVGEYYGTLRFFENTGDAANPTFVEQTGAANPFDGVDVGYNAAPAFVDIDDDGDFDAFIGEKYGTIRFFENTGDAANPTFEERTGADNPFDGIDVGDNACPTFVDIDDDGDFDAFIGEGYGTILFFENTTPAVETPTPTATATATPTNTSTPTATASPTATPTNTPIPLLAVRPVGGYGEPVSTLALLEHWIIAAFTILAAAAAALKRRLT